MQSGEKQIVLGKGEKEERKKERKEKNEKEKRKKEGEKRTKRKKKKERGKRLGEAIRNEKKYGGVSSDSVYFKSLDFPWNLSI